MKFKENAMKIFSGGLMLASPVVTAPVSIMALANDANADPLKPKKVSGQATAQAQKEQQTDQKAKADAKTPLSAGTSTDAAVSKAGANNYNGNPHQKDFKAQMVKNFQEMGYSQKQAIDEFNKMRMDMARGEIHDPSLAQSLDQESLNLYQAWMKDTNPLKNPTVARWLAKGPDYFKTDKKAVKEVKKQAKNPDSAEFMRAQTQAGNTGGLNVYGAIDNDDVIDGTLSPNESWDTTDGDGKDSGPHNKIVRSNDSVNFPYKVVINPSDGKVHKNLTVRVTGKLIAMNGKYQSQDPSDGSFSGNEVGTQVAQFAQGSKSNNDGNPNEEGFSNFLFDQTYPVSSSSQGLTVPVVVNTLSAQDKDFFKIVLQATVYDGSAALQTTESTSDNITISAHPNVQMFMTEGGRMDLNWYKPDGKDFNGFGTLVSLAAGVVPLAGRQDMKGATAPKSRMTAQVTQQARFFANGNVLDKEHGGGSDVTSWDSNNSETIKDDPMKVIDYGGIMDHYDDPAMQKKYGSWNNHPQTISANTRYEMPKLSQFFGYPYSWNRKEVNVNGAYASVRDSGQAFDNGPVQITESATANSEGYKDLIVNFKDFKIGKYPMATAAGSSVPQAVLPFATAAMYMTYPTPKFATTENSAYIRRLKVIDVQADNADGKMVESPITANIGGWKTTLDITAANSAQGRGYTLCTNFRDEDNNQLANDPGGWGKLVRNQIFQQETVFCKSGVQPFGSSKIIRWNPDAVHLIDAPDGTDINQVKYNRLDEQGKPTTSAAADDNIGYSLFSSPSGVKGVTWRNRPRTSTGQEIPNSAMTYRFGVRKDDGAKDAYQFYGVKGGDQSGNGVGDDMRNIGTTDVNTFYYLQTRRVNLSGQHESPDQYTWYDNLSAVPSDKQNRVSAIQIKTTSREGYLDNGSWMRVCVWLQVNKDTPIGNSDKNGNDYGGYSSYQEFFDGSHQDEGEFIEPVNTQGFIWTLKGPEQDSQRWVEGRRGGYVHAQFNADESPKTPEDYKTAWANLHGYHITEPHSSIRQWVSDPSNLYTPEQQAHFEAATSIITDHDKGTPTALNIKIDIPDGLILDQDNVYWGDPNDGGIKLKLDSVGEDKVASYKSSTADGGYNQSNAVNDGGTYGTGRDGLKYKQYVYKIDPSDPAFKNSKVKPPLVNSPNEHLFYTTKFDPAKIKNWQTNNGDSSVDQANNLLLSTLKTRVISELPNTSEENNPPANYGNRIWDAEVILAKTRSLGATLSLTADDGNDPTDDVREKAYTLKIYPWGDSEDKENGLFVVPYSKDNGRNGLNGAQTVTADSDGSIVHGSTTVKKIHYNTSKIKMWYYDGETQPQVGTDPNTIDPNTAGWHNVASDTDISAVPNVKAIYWQFLTRTTKEDKLIVDDNDNVFDQYGKASNAEPMITLGLDHRGNQGGDKYYNSVTINSASNYSPPVLSNTRLYAVRDYRIAGYVWYDKKNDNVYDHLVKQDNGTYQYMAPKDDGQVHDIPLGQERLLDSKGQPIWSTIDKDGRLLTDGTGTKIKDKWGNYYYVSKKTEQNPYAGIPVHLYKVDFGTKALTQVVKDAEGNDLTQIYTDETGHYEFDNLQAGTYQVGFGNGDEFKKSFNVVTPGLDDNASKVDNQNPKTNKLNDHQDLLLKDPIVLNSSNPMKSEQSLFNNLGIIWLQANPTIKKEHEISVTNPDGTHQVQNGFRTDENKQEKFGANDIITYRLTVTNNGGPYYGTVYDDLSDVRYNNDGQGHPMSDYVKVISNSTTVQIPGQPAANIKDRPAIDDFGNILTDPNKDDDTDNIIWNDDRNRFDTNDAWSSLKYTGKDGKKHNQLVKLDTGRIPEVNPAGLKQITDHQGQNHVNNSYDTTAANYKGLNPFYLEYGQTAVVTFQVKITKVPLSLKLNNTAFTVGHDPDGHPITPPGDQDKVNVKPSPGELDLIKHAYPSDYEPKDRNDKTNLLDGTTLKVGQEFKYVIWMNQTQATGMVKDATFHDKVPEGVEYVAKSAKAFNGTTPVTKDVEPVNNQFTVNIGDLGPNGSGRLEFIVKVSDKTQDRIVNIATGTGKDVPDTPPSKVDNFLEPHPVLQKYVSSSPNIPDAQEPHGNLNRQIVYMGDEFYYKIKVTNQKGGTWSDATIHDVLPAELEVIPNTTKVYTGNATTNKYDQEPKKLSDHDAWYDKFVDSPELKAQLGDITAYDNNSRIVIFKVRLIKLPNSVSGDGYTKDKVNPASDHV